MNKVDAVRKLNERELQLGLAGTPGSWHEQYKHSPVIYIGGLSSALTEGDVLTVFEQVGTINHINLVRDEQTGKPRGFCFAAYDDSRSAVLAVDNFNGVNLHEKTISVDHVSKYTPPDSDKAAYFDLPPVVRNSATPTAEERQATHGEQRPPVTTQDENARQSVILARLRNMRQMRAASEKSRSKRNSAQTTDADSINYSLNEFHAVEDRRLGKSSPRKSSDTRMDTMPNADRDREPSEDSREARKRLKQERKKFRRHVREERERKRSRWREKHES